MKRHGKAFHAKQNQQPCTPSPYKCEMVFAATQQKQKVRAMSKPTSRRSELSFAAIPRHDDLIAILLTRQRAPSLPLNLISHSSPLSLLPLLAREIIHVVDRDRKDKKETRTRSPCLGFKDFCRTRLYHNRIKNQKLHPSHFPKHQRPMPPPPSLLLRSKLGV